MMDRLPAWLDNPILVKHARSRLRLGQLLPSVAVVVVLALSIVLLGYQYNGLSGGQTFGGLMTLQFVILGVIGGSQVGSSVSKARESGILDFHRVSPMSPFSEALGFGFGAPIREYLMFLATLPFSMVCVGMGRPSFLGFFQLMASMVLVSWTLHAVSLLNALAGKGGKSANRGVIGLVMFLIFGASWIAPNFSVAATAVDETPMGHFFAIPLPWLLILGLDLLPAIGFLLVASTRKMASERAHALSKPQAVACLSTGALLVIGGLWSIESNFYWTLVVLYALIGVSVILISAVTPSLDEFSKGVRKAAKEGRKSPSSWSDRGLNRDRAGLLLRGGPGGLDGGLADDRATGHVDRPTVSVFGDLVLAADRHRGSGGRLLRAGLAVLPAPVSASEERRSSHSSSSPTGCSRWPSGRSPPPRSPRSERPTRPPTSGPPRSPA